jgi:hypothetical protein
VQLIGRTHPATQWGFPCCVDPPAHACRRPLPRRNRWSYFSLNASSDGSLPHSSEWVGFRIILFGACSTVTTRCSLRARQVTIVTFYTEGFSRFVTSTTAPIATGWSESCRVGLSPTEIAPFSRRTELRANALRQWCDFGMRATDTTIGQVKAVPSE